MSQGCFNSKKETKKRENTVSSHVVVVASKNLLRVEVSNKRAVAEAVADAGQ